MTTTSLSSFDLNDISIELETSPTAFQPTTITRMLAKHLESVEGKSVLDLGCGVGVMGVYAAIKGASRVVAVDVMPEACMLATRNSSRNEVDDVVTVRCGSLFDPVEGEKFDVIINDVSAVVDEVARISPWYPPSIPTGGDDGADVIVTMLSNAPKHLNPGGALYFPTGTISNVKRTLDAAKASFGNNIKLIADNDIPFCTEFVENIDDMMRLRDSGVIDFKTRRSRHLWNLQIYKAWL